MSTRSPPSRAHSLEISRPAADNWRSDCADVAGTDKYWLGRVAVAGCVACPPRRDFFMPRVITLPRTDTERCDGWLRRFAGRHDVGMRRPRCQVMPQATRTAADTHQLLRTQLTLSFTAAQLFPMLPNPRLVGSFRRHRTTISCTF